jgi:hypothetical protein
VFGRIVVEREQLVKAVGELRRLGRAPSTLPILCTLCRGRIMPTWPWVDGRGDRSGEIGIIRARRSTIFGPSLELLGFLHLSGVRPAGSAGAVAGRRLTGLPWGLGPESGTRWSANCTGHAPSTSWVQLGTNLLARAPIGGILDWVTSDPVWHVSQRRVNGRGWARRVNGV